MPKSVVRVRYPINYPRDVAKLRLEYNLPTSVTVDVDVVRRYENKYVIYETAPIDYFSYLNLLLPLGRSGLVAEWLFFEGGGTTLHDTSGHNIHGTIYNMTWQQLSSGKWVGSFNGTRSYVYIPNTYLINTGGPYPNRTIEVLFLARRPELTARHQVIWEEGGTARGFNIYVIGGKLYGGGWNKPETGWEGTWISTPIEPNRWYHAVLVLRNATDSVEPDKLEFYVNGSLIDKGPASQVYAHSGNICIGAVLGDSKFHDTREFSGSGEYFDGYIALVRVYNQALVWDDIQELYELAKWALGMS